MTTAPLLVVQTYFCAPHRGVAAHYEVHLARADRQLLPPLVFRYHAIACTCTVLLTTDDAAYQDALDAEGTDHRVVATYHDEARRHVLDRLEAAC